MKLHTAIHLVQDSRDGTYVGKRTNFGTNGQPQVYWSAALAKRVATHHNKGLSDRPFQAVAVELASTVMF